MKKQIIAAVCAIILIPTFSLRINAEYKESDLKNAVTKAIEWKDKNDSPFYSIGTNNSNLYITALKRIGKSYDYNTYLHGLDGIAAGYGEEHNASDMQRTALATIASGGDPRNVGGRDLIADSTYYRNATAPIDKEGVNGYSWALITLDSMGYETPQWALKNRNDIIVGILSHQNTNGSFDDSVYATASAITALAPYRETSGAYTITQNQTGWTFDLSPNDAINKALDYLDAEQLRDGDWGELRSTAMTVIALDTIGINADGDDRFTATKGTALEGLMTYQGKNGGFSADGNKADGEATSLALCALTSHLRKVQGKTTFFNFAVSDSINLSDTIATAKPTATPQITKKPAATPKATKKPAAKSTTKPTNTMQPTKTAKPKSDDDDEELPIATVTPRATRRPALVGPVEMPGPMPSVIPTELPEEMADEARDEKSNSPAAAIVVTVIALLALCGAEVIWYMNKTGKLSNSKIFEKLANFRKKSPAEPYKIKLHRKTEEYRHYEKRERYRQRKKYDRHGRK